MFALDLAKLSKRLKELWNQVKARFMGAMLNFIPHINIFNKTPFLIIDYSNLSQNRSFFKTNKEPYDDILLWWKFDKFQFARAVSSAMELGVYPKTGSAIPISIAKIKLTKLAVVIRIPNVCLLLRLAMGRWIVPGARTSGIVVSPHSLSPSRNNLWCARETFSVPDIFSLHLDSAIEQIKRECGTWAIRGFPRGKQHFSTRLHHSLGRGLFREIDVLTFGIRVSWEVICHKQITGYWMQTCEMSSVSKKCNSCSEAKSSILSSHNANYSAVSEPKAQQNLRLRRPPLSMLKMFQNCPEQKEYKTVELTCLDYGTNSQVKMKLSWDL